MQSETLRLYSLADTAITNVVADLDNGKITTVPVSYFEERKLPLSLVEFRAHKMGFATRRDNNGNAIAISAADPNADADAHSDSGGQAGRISFVYMQPRGQNEIFRITEDADQDRAYNREVQRVRRKLPPGFTL